MQQPQTPHNLTELRATITRLERGCAPANAPPPLPFGLPPIDDALPGGGLPLGALHELAGTGADLTHAAASALFAAGILARIAGPVLWVLEQHDLFAPGLAAAGLDPDRVIYAEAGRKHALLVMEEGLRHRGLAGVVAELSGRVTLSASRRLQLAAEATGVTALLLRRPDRGEAELAGAVAAVTRWRIAALPSAPPIPHAPDVPGLGRARWQLDLLRCRGGRTGSWTTEACDATGHLGLVAPLADRPAAPNRARRAAA
jgi:protein ImuA